jgi:PHD/YefM family antitoxin component YafN of YafNO toxin-antitoxin module
MVIEKTKGLTFTFIHPIEDKMSKIQELFLVDRNGKKTAVVLTVEDYERLLEDIHDLSVIAERRAEPTISFDKLRQRLRTDGLIQN